MAKRFELLIHADEDIATTIVDLLKNSGADLVSMTPVVSRKKIHRGFVNGVRNKGIRGEDLAIEILASCSKPITGVECEEHFKKKGFAAKSAHSTLSRLLSEKKIEKNGSGYYLKGRYTNGQG